MAGGRNRTHFQIAQHRPEQQSRFNNLVIRNMSGELF